MPPTATVEAPASKKPASIQELRAAIPNANAAALLTLIEKGASVADALASVPDEPDRAGWLHGEDLTTALEKKKQSTLARIDAAFAHCVAEAQKKADDMHAATGVKVDDKAQFMPKLMYVNAEFRRMYVTTNAWGDVPIRDDAKLGTAVSEFEEFTRGLDKEGNPLRRRRAKLVDAEFRFEY